MRIFFIHGFGETPAIFNSIAPAIDGEQVLIDLWETLGHGKREGLNVFTFAKEVIAKYHITSNDCVIGHSLGGWIAWYIKLQTGCRIVQIASFTDFKKLLIPIRSGRLIYWLVRKGLLFNNLTDWLSARPYRKLPSMQVHLDNIKRLRFANREAVVKQLQILYEPGDQNTVVPDLRIHALQDLLVKPPDEAFCIVPGDHYSLVTHPQTVLLPIQQLLKS